MNVKREKNRFTNAEAFDAELSSEAINKQKGILMGATLFLDTIFFEHERHEGADAAAFDA